MCRSSYASLLKCINGTSTNCMSTSVPYAAGWYTLMDGHNATYIPQGVTSGYNVAAPGSPASDYGLTNFPFWVWGSAHWAVGGSYNRWEVDDSAGNGCR